MVSQSETMKGRPMSPLTGLGGFVGRDSRDAAPMALTERTASQRNAQWGRI